MIPLQMVHSITFDTDTKHKARAAGAQGFIIDLHDGEAATFRCTTPAECGNWVRRLRSSASILSFADIDVVRAIDFPVGAFADVFQASATLPFQSVQQTVAIKTLSTLQRETDPLQGMILREIRTLRCSPKHANMVQFYGSGVRPDGRRFYIMVSIRVRYY